MRIAHLILVHKDPEHVERLIRLMNHPAFDFYIHIDKKVDAGLFYKLYQQKNVFPIKNRTKVYWGGWGTIQATLNGFNEISGEYDYINVMSGQDFPIKSAEFIFQFFLKRKGKEFITCESIEEGPWKVAAPRVKRYHFVNWKIPGKYRLQNLVNKIMPERKFPLDHTFVGRANWFALSREAIQYCLQFLKEHPEVIRFYKLCWGADEFIFSTILYNSHFKPNIFENLTYVDWSEGKARPKTLLKEDFTLLTKSDKLLARKFDATVDREIMDMLEAHILKSREITN